MVVLFEVSLSPQVKQSVIISNKLIYTNCFPSNYEYPFIGVNIFVVRTARRIISGWSVGKIIIINLSFRVSISKNKHIDQQGKET